MMNIREASTLLGHPHELFLLGGGCAANDKHARGVAVVAVDTQGHVDVDNVARLEHIFFFRDAMTHHLVDARAHTLGKSLIVQTCRNSTMGLAIGHADVVYLLGVHTSMNLPCHLVEHTGIHHTGPADAFNLLFGKDKVARGHLLSLIFPIHHPLVQLREGLARQAMPSSLFIHFLHYIIYMQVCKAPFRNLHTCLLFWCKITTNY